jgi:hypothetical protein
MGLFSENSSDISDWTHWMATATQHGSQAATEPQQPLPPQNAFANDSAHAAANALRDSLANNLLQWQILETKLSRADRDVPQYSRMVSTQLTRPSNSWSRITNHNIFGASRGPLGTLGIVTVGSLSPAQC